MNKAIASVISLLTVKQRNIKLHKEIESVRRSCVTRCYNVVRSMGPYFSMAGLVRVGPVRKIVTT